MPKPGARRGALIWLLAGLMVLAVAGGLALYRPFQSEARGTEGSTTDLTTPPPPPLPTKRTTFLVMGVDRREDDSGRADSMMVVSYDPESQQLAALSLPRDTWVQIPGHGYDKLNHSFAYGGDKLALATVEQLLGIPIDHYVTVTFQNFARIVDAIGGIEIDAEKRMLYTDPSDTGMGPDGLVIDIQPGLQHMDGMTALKYSRFRMDDEGDMGRVRRQQQVVRALMTAVVRPAIIGKVGSLIPALADAIDTDMTVAEMVRLGVGGMDAAKKPLKSGVVTGEPKALGGVFYFITDIAATRATAYEVLVGTQPGEEFLSRAKADEKSYEAALAEAVEHDLAVAAEQEKNNPPEQGQKPQPGTDGETTQPTEPTQPTQPGTGTTQPTTPPKPPAKVQPITVAVIDASGKNIAATWVPKLKAAGFRVARVSKASKPVARTVAIDHAGQPGTQERILAVLPGALVVANPDSKAEEAVEIVLGQDLLRK